MVKADFDKSGLNFCALVGVTQALGDSEQPGWVQLPDKSPVVTVACAVPQLHHET